MIQIKKSKKPPIVKYVVANHPNFGQEKYKVATNKICNDFRNNRASFLVAGKIFSDDFGANEFRTALISYQGNKCCYCEKAIGNGQIEHYRPKSAYQAARGSSLIRPGYYWLAYEWDNFLISCSDCNQADRKGTLFPVFSTKRAKKPSDPLNSEKPIIINPSKENPSKYITFNLSIPVGIDKKGRGNANIKIFDLKNRPDLTSSREDILEVYKTKKIIASIKTPMIGITLKTIKEAKIYLKNRKNAKQPFSGMLIENIKNGLI